ncbi:hypothetical protein [Roseovarius sp. ZX-A-9]|uniref:hypothetical protein n=1 Tax=Roseovarius sp. ZX-A-9 TaxID=3014783 RepID=UPI002331258F|nr:hypothetical protein [Roseovarius sp. ZX-A-9]
MDEVTPNLPASFSFSGHHAGIAQMLEPLPIDPNRVYRLGSYLRQEGLAGDWSAWTHGARHSQYMGLLCVDQDGLTIQAKHHMRYRQGGTDSLPTLAAPLAPGDTVVHLADASGWNDNSDAAYHRGLILFGYRNSLGVTFDRYSRLVAFDLFDLGGVNKGANTVTLNKPFPATLGNPADPSGIWPIGTEIAGSSNGSSYKYAFYDALHLPETDRWYHTLNYIGGIDRSGLNAPDNFPPGTAFAQVFWLANHSNRPGGMSGYPDTGAAHRVWLAGISVTPEPLAMMQPTSTGKQEIKVPKGDFATGTISLVPAGLHVTAE